MTEANRKMIIVSGGMEALVLASQIHADNEKLQSEVAGALRNLAGEKTPAEKEAEEAKKVADAAAQSSAATPAVAKPGGGPTPKGGKTTPASIPAAAPVSPTASPGTSARPNPLARKNSGFKAVEEGGVAPQKCLEGAVVPRQAQKGGGGGQSQEQDQSEMTELMLA